MSINSILYDLRTEKNLSQKDLAEAIGVSQSTIAKIEIGRNEATASTIRKLAKYFNISTDYLLELEDDTGMTSYTNELNAKEHELLSLFRQMNTAQQNRFIGIAEGMLEPSKKTKGV